MERKSCLLAIAVLTCMWTQNAYSQVSESVLNSLVGDNVDVELVEGNVTITGILKSVVEDSIVVVNEDGDVMQINKSDIKDIRVPPEADDTRAAELHRQKEFLYEQRKKGPWGPFVLNFLVGFGIGSFVQGDVTAGLLLAGGDLVGIGLVIAGAASVLAEIEYYDEGYPLESASSGGTLILLGAGILSATRIAGLIVPFTYANSFNEKLRRELGINVTDVALIVPGVTGDKHGGYGLMVTMAMES